MPQTLPLVLLTLYQVSSVLTPQIPRLLKRHGTVQAHRCIPASHKNRAHEVTSVTMGTLINVMTVFTRKQKTVRKFFLPTTHLSGHFPPKAKPTYKTHNVLVE